MVNIAQGFAAVFGYSDPSESQKYVQEVRRSWMRVVPGQSIHTEPLFHRPTRHLAGRVDAGMVRCTSQRL